MPRRAAIHHDQQEWPEHPLRVGQGISRVAGYQRVTWLLAASGIGSIPQCERLIAARRITVNGIPVREATIRADPARDILGVDGRPVALGARCRYLAFHKPYRVMSSFTDPERRPTLADYINVPGVYAAGRLDYDSEGLLLLSDDGWLLHRLTHPRYEHPKTYLVQVERIPHEQALEALRHGVIVEGERTRPAEVEWLAGPAEPRMPERSAPIRYRKSVPTAWLRVILYEGRKRQLRHMTAAVGYPTLRLIRTAIGPIALGDLAPGQWRELTDEELAALATMLHQPPERSDRANSPGRAQRARKR